VAFPLQFIAVVTAALVKANTEVDLHQPFLHKSTTFRIGKAILEVHVKLHKAFPTTKQ
jgi:hypothetical protein